MSTAVPAVLPPARPAYILRGHASPIHALHFTPQNERLISADADGWVVSWNLAYKRPAAAWKAHSNTILGLGSWGADRIITHGRDNKLLVWQLGSADEAILDKTLPVEVGSTSSETNRHPWLIFAMPVNALNFCAFAMCYESLYLPSDHELEFFDGANGAGIHQPVLFAVPNAIDNGGIDIFQLPSRKRVAMIHADRSITTGMVMCLRVLTCAARLLVVAGFESGHTAVYVQSDPCAAFEKLYSSRPHTQPVLALDLAPARDHYITSSVDANVAKHPLPCQPSIFKIDSKPIKVIGTKHSGQQGLTYRSDGKIFASAGWDKAIRVYAGKSMREAAVLKWHKEGCFVTAFAKVFPAQEVKVESLPAPPSITSLPPPTALFSKPAADPLVKGLAAEEEPRPDPALPSTTQAKCPTDEKAKPEPTDTPMPILSPRDSKRRRRTSSPDGQGTSSSPSSSKLSSSLSSDDATGSSGGASEPKRKKSTKSAIEVALAETQASFSSPSSPLIPATSILEAQPTRIVETQQAAPRIPEIQMSGGTVQRQREEKARTTHWLAAGSKDGKISLWDIY